MVSDDPRREPPRGDDPRGIAGSDGFVATAGGLVVAAGVALAAMRYVGGQPMERGLEGLLAAAALGAVVAAPGVLALLALRDRPALLLPAATVLFPASFLSLAGVTLPLLIPAVMLFVAYGRRSAGSGHRRSWAVLTTVAVLCLLFAGGVALLVHDDPRTHTTATSSHSTSDVITYVESLLSLSLTASAVAVGWRMTSRE